MPLAVRRIGACAAVLLAAGIAATAATVLSVPASAEAKYPRLRQRACPPKHDHLIAADAFAAVYVGVEPGGFSYDKAVFGCTRRAQTLLGGAPDCGLAKECSQVSHVVLGGIFAAYELNRYGPFEQDWTVVVRSLDSGRVLREAPSGVAVPGNVGAGPLTGLALRPNGSVAWMAEDETRSTLAPNGTPAIRYMDVYADDRTGERLLAAGSDIGPSSLALCGPFIYWTQGGKPMSAPLN